MKTFVREYSHQVGRYSWLVAGASFLALAALAFLVPSTTIHASRDPAPQPFSLAGSWQYQMGQPPGPTFTAFETFTEAGGSVEINHGPGGPTTGIGAWKRIGPREFLASLFKQQFDAAGNHAATIKVRRLITITPQGDELTGVDFVEVFDPAGNLAFSPPPSSFSGIRLAPEPLNP